MAMTSFLSEQMMDKAKGNLPTIISVALGYCAAGWGIIEASSFFVERYGASQNLLDLIIVLVVIGLPATLFLTWRHLSKAAVLESPLDKIPGIEKVKKLGLLGNEAHCAACKFAIFSTLIETGFVFHPQSAQRKITFKQFQPAKVQEVFHKMLQLLEAEATYKDNRLYIYPKGEKPWEGITMYGCLGDPTKPHRYEAEGTVLSLSAALGCICGWENLDLSCPTDLLSRQAEVTIKSCQYKEFLEQIATIFSVNVQVSEDKITVNDEAQTSR